MFGLPVAALVTTSRRRSVLRQRRQEPAREKAKHWGLLAVVRGEVEWSAELEPADAALEGIRCAPEFALDRGPALLEVGPALVVDGDQRAWAQNSGEFDGVACGHRVAQRSGDGELHATEVHQRC